MNASAITPIQSHCSTVSLRRRAPLVRPKATSRAPSASRFQAGGNTPGALGASGVASRGTVEGGPEETAAKDWSGAKAAAPALDSTPASDVPRGLPLARAALRTRCRVLPLRLAPAMPIPLLLVTVAVLGRSSLRLCHR